MYFHAHTHTQGNTVRYFQHLYRLVQLKLDFFLYIYIFLKYLTSTGYCSYNNKNYYSDAK